MILSPRSVHAIRPPAVMMSPSSTISLLVSTLTLGKRLANSFSYAQCVVTVRSARRPDSASTKAPRHTDARMAPALWRFLRYSMRAGEADRGDGACNVGGRTKTEGSRFPCEEVWYVRVNPPIR